MLINNGTTKTCMEPMLTDKGMQLVFKPGQLTGFGARLVKKEQILVFGEVPLIFSMPDFRVVMRDWPLHHFTRIGIPARALWLWPCRLYSLRRHALMRPRE